MREKRFRLLIACVIAILLLTSSLAVSSATTEEPEDVLYSLTVYTDFNIKIYVADDMGLTDILTKDGESVISTAARETVQGRGYYVLTECRAATELAIPVSFRLIYGDGEEQVISTTVLEYASDTLGDNCSEELRRLILSMLNYANEATVQLRGCENTAVTALLQQYGYKAEPQLYGKVYETERLLDVLEYGRLRLDSEPDFVFGVAEGFVGSLSLSYVNCEGKTVEREFELPADLNEDGTVMIENVRIYDMNNSITVKAEGSRGDDKVSVYGNYSLATYAHGIYSEQDTQGFATALSDYCSAAACYRGFASPEAAAKLGSLATSDKEIFTKKQTVLLLGQSNMSGRGDLDTVEAISDPRITMMREYSYVTMVEPIHLAKRGGAGLAASFAKAFVETFDCELGLVPCAVGGTSLADWAVGGELYNDALACARAALETSDICAILWHQGCSDMSIASEYAAKLKVILDSLMADLGLDKDKIVIVTGELGTFKGSARNEHTAQLNSLYSYYPNYGVASSTGLLALDVTTHFDAPSLRVFGYRYFDIFYKCVTGKSYSFVDDVESYRVAVADSEGVKELIIGKNFNSNVTGPAEDSGCDFKPMDGSTVIVEMTETEKYLQLTNGKSDTTGKTTDTYFDVTHGVAKNNIVSVKASFKITEGFKAEVQLLKLIEEVNGSAKGMQLITVTPDGKLYARQSGDNGYSVYLGYSLDVWEWTEIKVILDMANNRRIIYIEGNEVLRDNIVGGGGTSANRDISKVRAVHYAADTGIGTLCIDDYRLYIPANPPSFESDPPVVEPDPPVDETVTDYICNEEFSSLQIGSKYTSNASAADDIEIRTVNESSYVEIIADPDGAGDNVLVVKKGDSTYPYVDIKHKINKDTTFVIEGRFKLGENWNTQCDIMKMTTNVASTANIFVRINSDGCLYNWDYTNGSGVYGQKLCQLSSDEWTTVRVVCDLAANTKDIYINGVLVAEGLLARRVNMEDTTLPKCRVVHYANDSQSGSGEVYCDYVRYWYVE